MKNMSLVEFLSREDAEADVLGATIEKGTGTLKVKKGYGECQKPRTPEEFRKRMAVVTARTYLLANPRERCRFHAEGSMSVRFALAATLRTHAMAAARRTLPEAVGMVAARLPETISWGELPISSAVQSARPLWQASFRAWSEVHEIDIQNSPGSDWDLADESLQRKLLQQLAEGFYDVVLITPPCSTWSRVRGANCRGPPMIRSRDHPWVFHGYPSGTDGMQIWATR